MENQHQKWVNITYLGISALVAYALFALSLKLTGYFDIETRVKNVELILRIASVVVGGFLFLVFLKNDRINTFMNEVAVEVSRVTWPTSKETTSATVVVIVMVIVSGIILGLLDYVWTAAIQWLLTL